MIFGTRMIVYYIMVLASNLPEMITDYRLRSKPWKPQNKIK